MGYHNKETAQPDKGVHIYVHKSSFICIILTDCLIGWLDIVPTFIIKEFASELVPIITSIIYCSLMASSIPPALKTAIVTPILKKPSDELDELSNYRPVSNLPYLSKLLEKVVSSRLHNHKVTNNLYEHVQSAYRSGHSTETALVKVQNDILRAIDVEQQCVFLVLLDLSAAFDTITHQTLLSRMKQSLELLMRGIGG